MANEEHVAILRDNGRLAWDPRGVGFALPLAIVFRAFSRDELEPSLPVGLLPAPPARYRERFCISSGFGHRRTFRRWILVFLPQNRRRYQGDDQANRKRLGEGEGRIDEGVV